MKPLDQVAVFYLDQDAEVCPTLELISRETARAMKKSGAGWFINHGKGFRLLGRSPADELSALRNEELRPDPMTSCASISFSEMEANVGICDKRVRNPRETIRRAQAKVKFYPITFDHKAVRASSFWNFTQNLTVTAQA